MRRLSPRLRIPIFLAILCHIFLFVTLFVRSSANTYRTEHVSKKQPVKIVHVTAISSTQVQAQVNAIKKRRAEKKAAEVRRIKRLEAEAVAAKRARIREMNRLAELKAARKKLRLKIAREKAARIKRQKQLALKKALLAKQEKLQKKLIQQQLNSEKKNLKQIQTLANKGMIDRYKARILATIEANWRIQKVNNKIKCVYTVSIAPGGVVLQAKLIKSSGNEALDQSARQAIFKSSPLPVPKNPALFANFRHLVLSLSPQGYLR